jgi:hypothetical protein|tara:strand:- start:333 stop:797 length:465 start_codon:yes stop_codon:yes gene_type:complete
MQEKIVQWMKDFVEKPNPKLGNWAPCPYARAARINNQINIQQGTNPLIDIESINWTQEVYVFWYPTEEFTAQEFRQIAQDLNDSYMPDDIVILEDHPELVETVNGVSMNFGHSALLIVQRLKELNAAADKIRDKGYYDHWSKSEVDSVVSWRYK